jgi:signal transduction histidine kinase
VGGTRVQLQQVLVNLIMNAAEAMKDTSPDGRLIRVATSHDKDEVRVWVEDSGPGIDADRIDTIFEPLATWKPGGTGMGLAISNSIIEAHRGRMWAENRDGGGACVGFVLPVMKGSKGA